MINKVTKYLYIAFLSLASLCLLCLLLALIRLILPKVSLTDWDLLAFTGSMIAAVVTYMGIRAPILSQRKDQLMTRYSSIIKVLTLYSKKTRRIIFMTEFYNSLKEHEVTKERLQEQATVIKEYIENVSDLFAEIVNDVDLLTFENIEFKIRSLYGFINHYEAIDTHIQNYDSDSFFVFDIKDYLKQSKELEQYLVVYQQSLLVKYNEIRNRSVFRLTDPFKDII
ncbi:hypothetical protein SAMN05720606_108172 [Paenibacillus polysaccharolyticus]|uniref:Uncharacterized protein n=1 Tax=Paenibacillus polysaccharolyticus TaxID=582692 RepID=A0A1G5ICB2_9BACL|nr:hypothetical protein [Paenibacillus polysaccharolyticus]SCY73401.1 hypothetical protein SAMN05720606_108172 [Paenibacillus polysaccharolyticus]